MNQSPYELAPNEVIFSLDALPPPSEEGAVSAAIIGQGRALEALKLGLRMKAKGYNIFIMGKPGTGRRTALLKALSDYSGNGRALEDKAYVHNFRNALEPKALAFPAGGASEFKRDIHDLIEEVKRIVASNEDSHAYLSQKNAIASELDSRENRRLTDFESELVEKGFKVIQTAEGDDQSTELVPIWNGEATSFEALQAKVDEGLLSQESWNEWRERYYLSIDSMKKLFNEIKRSRTDLERSLNALRVSLLKPIVEERISELKYKYSDAKAQAWLETLGADIVDRIYLFDRARQEETNSGKRRYNPVLARYSVNVVVDHAGDDRPPIVFENRPTLTNLLGTMEQSSDRAGESRTGYLRIRAGSLLKASGGILVLRAEDLMAEEDAWQYLKRVLQTGSVELQSAQNALAPQYILKPEAMPVSLKVVVIGGEASYDLLYQADPDFPKLFKVCAEFSSSMERTPLTESLYVAFLRRFVEEEGLRPLSDDGALAVLEESVRDTEYRDRLSTLFSAIADLLREADYWAEQEEKSFLDASSIRRALSQRTFFRNLPEAEFERMILSGEILIELNGRAIGKANGLAIHDRGYYAFGCPVVVSARTAPGDGGVINIEGESGLSGEIFDKAVLILSGYLRSRYAHDFPLSLTCSVCFEQSYTEIDGDSATVVQLSAILSALSGLPLRQELALTGSVNQWGMIQPVGGVSRKIEGFYSICSKRGLTGSQGVIIPRKNINSLMLNHETEAAIARGDFHVYAIDTIDQALEILSGVNAGAEDGNGEFPQGSVNGLVSEELRRMADLVHRYET